MERGRSCAIEYLASFSLSGWTGIILKTDLCEPRDREGVSRTRLLIANKRIAIQEQHEINQLNQTFKMPSSMWTRVNGRLWRTMEYPGVAESIASIERVAKKKEEKCECDSTENLRKVLVGGTYEGNVYETWCASCVEEGEEMAREEDEESEEAKEAWAKEWAKISAILSAVEKGEMTTAEGAEAYQKMLPTAR
jgi:hypothetical protein